MRFLKKIERGTLERGATVNRPEKKVIRERRGTVLSLARDSKLFHLFPPHHTAPRYPEVSRGGDYPLFVSFKGLVGSVGGAGARYYQGLALRKKKKSVPR